MMQSTIPIYEVEESLRLGYYKDSYWRFFRDAWHVLEPETPLVENWHMKYIAGELEKIFHQVNEKRPRDKDLIINVPPATTKSNLITIIFPVWCWICAPHMKIINMSHDASLAMDHAVKSRDLILSEWFQKRFGHIFTLKYDVNKKSEFATNKGGIRRALGVGQKPTGKHGDILICDDPLDPEGAINDKATAKVNRWWDRSISTRMTDAAVTVKIIVMQRLSINDLTGHCLKNNPGRYRHICLPATLRPNLKPASLASHYDQNGGMLSPRRLSLAILEDFKKQLGSIGYAGQYDQEPVPEGGNLIKRDWIGRWDWESIKLRASNFAQRVTWNFYIDGAYTQDEINAPTAILVTASVGGWCLVRHAERQWMELPDLIKHIPKVCAEYGYDDESFIYVEPKASGKSIIQMLERFTTFNVMSGAVPKDSKVARTKSNLPFIESGHLRILTDAPWETMYMDELTTFPFSTYMDLTDVTNMAIDNVQADDSGGSNDILDMAVI